MSGESTYDVEHHSYETGEGFNSVMEIQAKDRLRKLTLTPRADRRLRGDLILRFTKLKLEGRK